MNKFAIKYDGKVYRAWQSSHLENCDFGIDVISKVKMIDLLLSGDAELVPDSSYREAISKRLDQLLKEIEEIRSEVSK